jgi:hypothetical protein
MEEDTAPLRRNNTLLLGGMGHTKLVYEVHRTHGCTEEPPVQPHRSTRSSAPPPHTLWYSNGFIIMTEEEEKLARLE